MIVRVLAAIIACLVLAQVTVQVLRFVTGNDRLYGFVYLFSLGGEANIPAFYATFSLLFTSLLLALVASSSRGDAELSMTHWLGLAAVFAFISLDEMVGFHERLSDPVRARLGTSGLLFYAWIIPYGLGVLALAGLYMRFLLRLPTRTGAKFVGAGILFVAGAIGAEMVGGLFFEEYGSASVAYVAIQTLEEVLEMVGVLVFISAILEYADLRFGGLRLDVSSGLVAEPAPSRGSIAVPSMQEPPRREHSGDYRGGALGAEGAVPMAPEPSDTGS